MNFLYPLFLFGLLAVSIPVIIHLFNFQRPKTILFTNVKFLKNVKEITTSRLKLKHLLVLACRILFISFLVFAFAQPFIAGNNAKQMQSKPNVLAYVDNSYSMQSGNNGENLLDLAIRDFTKLSELYPLNTQFQITTNDFEGKDQFLINKDKLAERLTSGSTSTRIALGVAFNDLFLQRILAGIDLDLIAAGRIQSGAEFVRPGLFDIRNYVLV